MTAARRRKVAGRLAFRYTRAPQRNCCCVFPGAPDSGWDRKSTGMTTEAQPSATPATTSPSGDASGGRVQRTSPSTRAGHDAAKAAFLAEDKSAEPVVHRDDKAEDAAAAEDTDAPAGAAADPPEAAPAAKVDPETEKRLAGLQAADKRNRDKLAAERAEVAAERAAAAKERAELEADRQALADFRKLRERAKVDPVAALEALGVDDFEHAAKSAYAKHKGDPANKAEVARTMREKELAAEIAELKTWREQQTQAAKAQAENAAIERETAAYVATLKTEAGKGEVSPLAKHFMAKSPAKTEQKLRQIAVELLNETGDTPDHADVLARYEQVRAAELEELGIDPATLSISTQKTETKKQDLEAVKKNAAKTLENTMSTSRVPRSSSDKEQRASARAEFVKAG